MDDPNIRSRKKDHVDLVVGGDVRFRTRTAGFDGVELEYNALPECDLTDVDTSTAILGHRLRMPLVVSSMTGGYAEAEAVNEGLAAVCRRHGIGMGVGSMRAALNDPELESTFTVVRRERPPLLFTNIGAPQVAAWYADGTLLQSCSRLVSLLDADALAVHCNPLQELLQPEGQPRFRGVLDGIAALVRDLGFPIIVKEVGAGLGRGVVRRLVDVGVHAIDVAGAGGTSWAGVEILRRTDGPAVDHLWDVGIPTVDCLREARPLCDATTTSLWASGGIMSGTDMAKALALGAHCCGSARPLLQAWMAGGHDALSTLLDRWELHLRQWMFLTGKPTVDDLRTAPLRVIL